MLLLFLLGAFMVVSARLYHSRKFTFFLSLPVKAGGRDFEEEFNPYGVKDLFDVLLTLNSYLSIGIGCYLIVYSGGYSGVNFVRILFVLLLFFLLKNMFQLFVGWLFRVQNIVIWAQNTALAYRSWFGMILLPLLFLVVYTPFFRSVILEISAVVMIITYGISFFVSSSRLWKMPGSVYYKFLYICALELTPFFFLVKWLASLME